MSPVLEHLPFPVEQQNDRSDYTRSISIAESRKVLQKLFDQMNEDFMFLKTKCRLHGDRIMSRWKKRSREKRELWLLQADPNLCVDRWHLLRYVCMDAHLPWENARKLRKNFLLPYLSVDVLKNDPALFLSLLYNRTYYHPYMWAPSDSMELATGWNLCYLDVEISGACVAMYRENYGSLVAWDAQAAHRSDIVPFPRAKLILEAQACLLRFLRDVVNQILGEADIQSATGSAKFMEMARTAFRSGHSGYRSHRTYHAFSAPPYIHVDDLTARAKVQMDAAADHLWLLQT